MDQKGKKKTHTQTQVSDVSFEELPGLIGLVEKILPNQLE